MTTEDISVMKEVIMKEVIQEYVDRIKAMHEDINGNK